MKAQIKLLGIDDGPFEFNQQNTVLVGTIMRANGYLEGILTRHICIDGSEATNILIEMISKTTHRLQLKALLLDGIAVGGFNIIDIKKVYNETNLPIITITRDPPDFEKIKKALKSHFTDWKKRYEQIQTGPLYQVKTNHKPLYMNCIGLDNEKAKEIITLSTIRGVIPEPIRVAHLIASGIMRGESYGKA